MSAPAVVIRLEIEEPVVVYVDALGKSEYVRLLDWLDAHPALRDLLDTARTLQGRAAA
jgi:hypothetical protein